MADTGTICDLIDHRHALSAERPETVARKLHWSDIMVAVLGLVFLVAVSIHVSPAKSRVDIAPIAFKTTQEG